VRPERQHDAIEPVLDVADLVAVHASVDEREVKGTSESPTKTMRLSGRLSVGALGALTRPPASRGVVATSTIRVYADAMSDATIAIRPAEPRDLPAVGRMGAALVRMHHGFDPRRFLTPPKDAEAGYAWFLGTQLTRDDVVVVVAERGDDIVGYVYAGIQPMSWMELREEAGFIYDIFVVDEARGSGAAAALAEAAMRWLAGRGMPRVLLWTAPPNAAALRFFTRLGFRQTMVEMTRELEPPGGGGGCAP
jgi:ribosomal protein S18 acetylase RimI-like enzyme